MITTMDNIQCPHCGKKVQISEALIHQLSEKVRIEEKQKAKAELEKSLAEQKAETEKKIRLELQKESKQKDVDLQQSLDRQKKLEEQIAKEQQEREKIEIKIREEATKKAEEDQKLTLKEKDIQIEQIKKANEDIRRANEDLKRKLEQGSQQMQGEALELHFEEKLKQTFPTDEFLPIPKGVEGGDIWQKVIFNGKTMGSILWETKRTKAWSRSWTSKLKDDAAKISASEAILVSNVLPDGSSAFGRQDGVWITGFEHAIAVCRNVRFLITTVASIKSSASQTHEEWGKVRDYMLSDAFKHRMQAHFDGVKSLREGLEAEKRATMLRWKKQESQIDKLDTNSINLYGELRSIVSELPKVEGLETTLLEDGKQDDQLL